MSLLVDIRKKTIYVPEGEHSDVGPSSSKRWIHCLASVGATCGLPSQSSRFAAEGSAAHALSEVCRKDKKAADDFLGWKILVANSGVADEFVIDSEMTYSVQEFVDQCEEIPGEALIEVRVNYDWYVAGGFGTLDDARIGDRLCTITDFKHGKGVQVFAKDNSQLMLQALGVYLDYGHLYEFEEFDLRISQPRLNHFDSWRVSLKDVLHWADTVAAPAAVKALAGSDVFQAGDWCQFCKIKAVCTARAGQLLKGALGDFEDLDSVSKKVYELGVMGDHAMTDAEIARLLPLMDSLRSWIKHVETYAVTSLRQGRSLGDWKLVEGRSNRAWAKSQKEVLDSLTGVQPVESLLTEPELISVAQVEKKVGKARFAELVKQHGLVRKPPGKPKLAAGDDPRPAMSLEALNEFGDLDASDDD